MFGYVMPVKCELRIRDFEAYRAVYCGVCKQLGESYGVASRFLLNYDLVLLAVIADAVSGEAGLANREGCFANPVSKRPMLHGTAGLQLASDGLVLLSYHKLADNLADEKLHRRIPYLLAKPPMAHMYHKAAKRRPGLDAIVSEQMRRQVALEKAGCQSLDEVADPTARMCEALFAEAATHERQRPILARLGLFAGQIVYLLDAAEDYEEDAARGRYNPMLLAGLSREEAVETAKRRCRMAAGEIALCYNLLELKQYKDILDNIFFLGLPAGINAAGRKRDRKGAGHGHIESV